MFSKVLSTGLLTLVALSARSVVADDCTKTYTVQPGDYCDQISRLNNVSTFQLSALNTGKYNAACTNLQIGAVLCLATSPDQNCQMTYTVKEGDTCDAISSAAGTNDTILYLNNPQIDEACLNIYVGEVLCTAPTVQVPPIPSTGLVVPVTGPSANNASNGDNGGGSNDGGNNSSSSPSPSVITVPPANNGGDYNNGSTSSPTPTPTPTPSPSPSSSSSAVNHEGTPVSKYVEPSDNDNGGDDDDQLPWCD